MVALLQRRVRFGLRLPVVEWNGMIGFVLRDVTGMIKTQRDCKMNFRLIPSSVSYYNS